MKLLKHPSVRDKLRGAVAKDNEDNNEDDA